MLSGRSGSLLLLFPLLLALGFPAASAAQCSVELQRLVPADGQPGDVFGYRVNHAGDLAVIGAPYDDDLGPDSGSAYVVARDAAGSWQLERKLTASDGVAGDIFGFAVAVEGETVFVGAPSKSGAQPGDGAVYVYERDLGGPGNWGELAKLTAPTPTPVAQFGRALDALGDRVLVGTPRDGFQPGSGFLYRRDPLAGAWTLERELVSPDIATMHRFGHTVMLAEGVAFLSSGEGSGPYAYSYVVHVRERDAGGAGQWGEVKQIASPTGAGLDFFAERIVASGDLLVASAAGEYDLATGTGGAAYLFGRDAGGPGNWGLVKRIHSPNAQLAGAFLAEEVAVGGDWLVAASPYEPANGLEDAGAVFVFARHAGGREAWGEIARIQAAAPAEDAYFGLEVSLAGDELLVGAPDGYGQGATSGAVHVLDLTRLARATWRSAGINPDAHAAGRPLIGTTWSATVDLAISGHAHAVLLGFLARDEVALPGGQVLLGRKRLAEVVRETARAGSLARFDVSVPLDPTLCGLELVSQALCFGAVTPFALSNAQDLVFGAQ